MAIAITSRYNTVIIIIVIIIINIIIIEWLFDEWMKNRSNVVSKTPFLHISAIRDFNNVDMVQ